MSEARERYGAKSVAHASMALMLDHKVDDGDTLPLGDLELEFIYTPGTAKTTSACCARTSSSPATSSSSAKWAVPTSATAPAREYDSLHNKIMKLPDHIEVWPGHDFGATPSSTIGEERRTNPFILQKSFEDFVHLKAHWIQYKRKHGIK